ncbi:MAG: hypothetical protein WD989_00845 [Candidatus Paceibacterota bacterium]
MAKSDLKIKARKLRSSGKSVKDISKIIGVSQSTISLWCRDIKLTEQQLNKILSEKGHLILQGRLKGANFQKMKRINAIKIAVQEAKKLNKLSEREFFMTGLALYLAEGTKTYGTVQFTNSNKKIIRFMIDWFRRFYNINNMDIKFSIHINAIHKNREKEIVSFWRRYLRTKPKNFTNIRYVKTRPAKKYENHNTYYGTMDFRIKKSTNLLYKLNALTDRFLTIPRL